MNVADRAQLALRRRIREEDDIALLNKRCYGIFRSMTIDAKEAGRLAEIDFTVIDLRAWSQALRGTACKWCGREMKAKAISWDHEIPVSRGGSYSQGNLAGICSTCNGQKGSLTKDEFSQLLTFLKSFVQQARGDIMRRLGLGARWRA